MSSPCKSLFSRGLTRCQKISGEIADEIAADAQLSKLLDGEKGFTSGESSVGPFVGGFGWRFEGQLFFHGGCGWRWWNVDDLFFKDLTVGFWGIFFLAPTLGRWWSSFWLAKYVQLKRVAFYRNTPYLREANPKGFEPWMGLMNGMSDQHPENERMSPENWWLVQMYSLLK